MASARAFGELRSKRCRALNPKPIWSSVADASVDTTSMMMRQLIGVIPQLLMMGFVYYIFGNVMVVRLPFTLLPNFRTMFQYGLTQLDLDATYISCLSLYILCMIGLRPLIPLVGAVFSFRAHGAASLGSSAFLQDRGLLAACESVRDLSATGKAKSKGIMSMFSGMQQQVDSMKTAIDAAAAAGGDDAVDGDGKGVTEEDRVQKQQDDITAKLVTAVRTAGGRVGVLVDDVRADVFHSLVEAATAHQGMHTMVSKAGTIRSVTGVASFEEEQDQQQQQHQQQQQGAQGAQGNQQQRAPGMMGMGMPGMGM